MASPLPSALRALLHRRFTRIVVFSGAGMSAESGIPTFRSGRNGLWNAFDPQALATPQAWRRDRDTVWGWYEWRRGLVMAASPHAGHGAVARLRNELDAEVVTQNVDNLHERAGADGVMHLHGSLFSPRCDTCGAPFSLTASPPPEPSRQRPPPPCPACPGAIRPGVVWFGESLDPAVVEAATAAIIRCDLLLIVGTSGMVYPAAGLVDLAPPDALIVEINPEPARSTGRIGYAWATTAATGLPALAEHLLAYSR
ncbi:NAD-dependent protein deacylase [Xylophilus sp. GOD-11R]|uniref:SIR2 family NAD-dependent protein deacylase n=1 Tax=Xylophilus sp. GOD-11R TaxID=3089814 RepID=UPI00298CBD51|nr:NAD-dependent protein deacylase [Xylophilus sp. GOD-11R]WPB59228.1 NAD-dependent protein deacylase [Xylophilus sp. GOD-11R]